MPEITLIMEKLQQQDSRMEAQTRQLEKIEQILIETAVQNNKISDLQNQMHTLWGKYDIVCSPGGVLAVMQDHQSKCPRAQMNRLWWAIGIVTSLYAGTIGVILTHISSAGGKP